MTDTHEGGCLCGAVRFEIDGTFERFFMCHCSRCRKVTGSAHASNLFSDAGRLNWVSGADKVTVYALPGSNFGKAFCALCGGALPRQRAGGQGLAVPAGCLDTPVALRPEAHIFCDSRADWDNALETVPQVAERP